MAFFRRRVRRGARVEVQLDLRLPDKWAAELTQRVLENDGVRSEVLQSGDHWLCRVHRPIRYDPRLVEQLCSKAGQIARARGGECVAHIVRSGSREIVFEH